ncbi:MAG: ATP-binding protein [Bacteroidales bacterium]
MDFDKGIFQDIGYLQAVLMHSPSAILVLDKNTQILEVNPAMEKISSYSREELLDQRKWTELVLSEDRDGLKNMLRMLKADDGSRPEQLQCRFVDRKGNPKTVLLSGTYLPGTKHTILSLIDITEHKETEKKLEVDRSRAEASDRLKTAFLGNLSHEIRTPMNAIVGFASLLQMEELSEDKKSLYLTQIINGSTDLLNLIEKTIVLSRIDLGQIKINRRQFFVNKSLQELTVKYRQILADYGKEDIDLEFLAGTTDNDFVIQADRLRIMEVLNNLLENAVKFTTSGKITFGYAYVEEDQGDGRDSLLFYVKDTGPGIARDKTGIIFDRFVKLVDKNDTVLRGAGLGLAIARDLVELMGGDMWVESNPGEGSKFYFTLPLTFSKAREAEPVHGQARPTYDDWSGRVVLVAEDIETNYLYIKELLSPTRINILRARDGLEAVEIFEKHPEIEIVLMDILMPGLDGYEATQRIRSSRPDIPVLAQTAFTFEGEIQDGLYAGCFTDYIMKPFTRDMLLAGIKKHLVRTT